jgi:hypothetical protein
MENEMKKIAPLYTLLTIALTSTAQLPAPSTSNEKITTVKEMLTSGPPQLQMHSLAMITQNQIPGGVDASYLDAFENCSNNPMAPIRSITARILGQHFIQDQPEPNTRAIELLLNLAQDPNADVRFSATVLGLCKLKPMTTPVLETLINTAITDRRASLLEAIQTALADLPETKQYLESKLESQADIASYELYRELINDEPLRAAAYLDLPSSRPRLFVFSTGQADLSSATKELQRQLKQIGINHNLIQSNDPQANSMLMLKTFITREYIEVEKHFTNHDQFPITQALWVTPEIEVQLQNF